MISAVARIHRPGAKADCCLILEGPQGIRKSTALRTLAGEYFTDELADLGSKDAAMQTRGVWIIELSELDSLSNSEVARIKAFMSRTTDRFRPPYGTRLMESPRQCVFAGTVNHATYLRDETGGRRFWPVTCGRIEIDELARDRDQLWAEAKIRFDSGAAWWLDKPELVQMASDQQIERYEGDPWEEVISPWLDAADVPLFPSEFEVQGELQPSRAHSGERLHEAREWRNPSAEDRIDLRHIRTIQQVERLSHEVQTCRLTKWDEL
jgi:predicted P-loop ATPase